MIGTASLAKQGGRTLPRKSDPRTRPERSLGPRSLSGFTLLEVVLVLALIVILGALLYPSLDSMYADYRLTAAADEVRARWAEARAQAVNEGRDYRFAVVRNGGNIRIAPDSAAFWGNGGTATQPDAVTPPLIVETALPRGVRVLLGDPVGLAAQDLEGETSLPLGNIGLDAWTGVVTFRPDGTADALDGRDSGVVRLTLVGKYATPLVLELRTLTGSVTTHRLYEVNRR